MALTRLNNRSVSAVTALPSGIDIPAGAIVRADLPVGTIIQTVAFRSQIGVSMTTTTLADTGYGATITPTNSSNKIKVTFACSELRSRGDVGANIDLYRNGTNIVAIFKEIGYSGGAGGTQTTGSIGMGAAWSYVDSPASTSALTYQVYARKLTSNAGNVEFLPNSTNSGAITIILEEIVA